MLWIHQIISGITEKSFPRAILPWYHVKVFKFSLPRDLFTAHTHVYTPSAHWIFTLSRHYFVIMIGTLTDNAHWLIKHCTVSVSPRVTHSSSPNFPFSEVYLKDLLYQSEGTENYVKASVIDFSKLDALGSIIEKVYNDSPTWFYCVLTKK